MIEVQIDTADVERLFKHLQDNAAPLAREIVRDSVAGHSKAMLLRIQRGSGTSVKSRTNRLANSLRMTSPARKPDGFEATSNIGRGVPYARIHEAGGRITPTKRKYLTVPLATAKTPKGVVRKTAALRRQGSGYATTGKVPGAAGQRTFIYGRGDRKFIAVERQGGGALPLYILKKSVDIKARLGFVKVWRAQEGKRRQMMRAKLQRVIAGMKP